MKNYDIIFFDIDNTLFDFTAAEKTAFSNVFEQHKIADNLAKYKKSYREISDGLWDDLEKGKINLQTLSAERFNRLFSKYNIPLDPVNFNDAYLQELSEQTMLMPGAEEAINALTGKRLAVMTNGFVKVQTPRIARSRLHRNFEEIIISEAAGYHKPHQGIFDYAFKQLNIKDKENVLIVGDSLTSDIQGGMHYGIDTCWYNPEQKHNETTITPTYEINQLIDLPAIVTARNKQRAN